MDEGFKQKVYFISKQIRQKRSSYCLHVCVLHGVMRGRYKYKDVGHIYQELAVWQVHGIFFSLFSVLFAHMGKIC